jgi:hypothetical protein
MLQLDNVSTIPNRFHLSIPSKGQSYQAKMVWQQLGRAGLVFENVKQDTREAAVPSRVDGRRRSVPDPDRLQQRIEAVLNR